MENSKLYRLLHFLLSREATCFVDSVRRTILTVIFHVIIGILFLVRPKIQVFLIILISIADRTHYVA